jgi:tape measure domain-containing protein
MCISSITTSALETSFSNLLSAMGADSSDASSQLCNFVQALASGMPQARSSGKLVHTTA